jgi:hypothetical protein
MNLTTTNDPSRFRIAPVDLRMQYTIKPFGHPTVHGNRWGLYSRRLGFVCHKRSVQELLNLLLAMEPQQPFSVEVKGRP